MGRQELAAARIRLLAAVEAIWEHTVAHTRYVPGQGYVWQTGDPPCADPAEHLRLAAAEGEAWKVYSELRG